MPTPHHITAWWKNHRVDGCALTYYAGTVLVGTIGLRDASPAMERTATSVGAVIYGLGMILFGVLAAISVLSRARKSEAVAVGGIMLLTAVHAGTIIATPDGSGVLTGTRLAIALPFFLAYLFLRTDTAVTRPQLERQLLAHRRVEEAQRSTHPRRRGPDA